MSDPIRELLAFLVAKELRMVCYCGAPATQESNDSCRPPQCDECVEKHGSHWTDWRDLRHAAAIRKLLA